LILVAASFAFLFLVNRNNLSIKETNVSLLEAQSILRGKITLPEREFDAAFYGGETLNVFQPGQTLFFLAHLIASGGDGGVGFFQAEMFLVFVLTTFFFSMAIYRLTNGQGILSLTIAASFMFGAPYIANLPIALKGSVYRVNNILAILCVVIFLFIVSSKIFEKKLLLAGACLGAAMLFRLQNTLLVALPLLLLLQDHDGTSWRFSERFSTPVERTKLAVQAAKLLIFPLLALIVIGGFQMARFQNPLETGYAYIYVDRTDYLAQRAATYGLFSLHFLPENLYQTVLAFPTLKFDGLRLVKIIGDPKGNSLLFSQPILLLLIVLGKSLSKARVKSYLFVCLLLAAPVWLYHNPGLTAHGYMRYSLDYLPLWLATIAVFASYAPKSRFVTYISIFFAIWSILYGIALLNVRVQPLT
jgi:hypothetical protein